MRRITRYNLCSSKVSGCSTQTLKLLDSSRSNTKALLKHSTKNYSYLNYLQTSILIFNIKQTSVAYGLILSTILKALLRAKLKQSLPLQECHTTINPNQESQAFLSKKIKTKYIIIHLFWLAQLLVALPMNTIRRKTDGLI